MKNNLTCPTCGVPVKVMGGSGMGSTRFYEPQTLTIEAVVKAIQEARHGFLSVEKAYQLTERVKERLEK